MTKYVFVGIDETTRTRLYRAVEERWPDRIKESRGRDSSGEPGADTRAQERGHPVANEAGSHPAPSPLDELRAEYERHWDFVDHECSSQGSCDDARLRAAEAFIEALEAENARLRAEANLGGSRDYWRNEWRRSEQAFVGQRDRAEAAERERDDYKKQYLQKRIGAGGG